MLEMSFVRRLENPGKHIMCDKMLKYCEDIINRKLRSSLTLRLLAAPYMTAKRTFEYHRYQGSCDSAKLGSLKNRYPGKRCFVIGNGPSLTAGDLEKLADEITIASNRIYNIFADTDWRPLFYMAEDVDGFEEMVPNILGQRIPYIVLNSRAKRNMLFAEDNIYWGQWGDGRYVINRYNDKSIHMSEDVSDHFGIGYTVTFSAVQLAIYMGIREIYLIGVDFDYSVVADKWGRMKRLDGVKTYFDGRERGGSYLNYYSTLRAYEAAKEYCDLHDIKIMNATRGGKLEVFDRVDFDNLFYTYGEFENSMAPVRVREVCNV